MIIQLDTMIEQAKDIDDVKVILRQIVNALNTLSDAKRIARQDLIFKDSTKGPVWIGTDGHYYRGTISVSGGTTTLTLTDLGTNEPSGG